MDDSKQYFKITAVYPDEKLPELHNHLRTNLNFADLTDLSNLKIRQYETLDKSMTISIESKKGYLKIVLDKENNSPEALRKLKKMGKDLELILR